MADEIKESPADKVKRLMTELDAKNKAAREKKQEEDKKAEVERQAAKQSHELERLKATPMTIPASMIPDAFGKVEEQRKAFHESIDNQREIKISLIASALKDSGADSMSQGKALERIKEILGW